MAKNWIDTTVDSLEPYYTTQAPFQLPDTTVKKIADFVWLISLAFGVLSIAIAAGAIGFWRYTGSIGPALGATPSPVYWLGVVLLILQAVLLIMAVPGLKKNHYRTGWLYLFYGVVASIASGLVMALAGDFGSLFGAVLMLLIGPYVLYQIKPRFAGATVQAPHPAADTSPPQNEAAEMQPSESSEQPPSAPQDNEDNSAPKQ